MFNFHIEGRTNKFVSEARVAQDPIRHALSSEYQILWNSSVHGMVIVWPVWVFVTPITSVFVIWVPERRPRTKVTPLVKPIWPAHELVGQISEYFH